MSGLIESDQGLAYGTGLIWLYGGLGGEGLVDPPLPDLFDRFSAQVYDRFGGTIQARGQPLPEDVHDRTNAVIDDRFGADIQTRAPL